MRVAVDAMGGDVGPAAMVEGAVLAARASSDVQITLVGLTGQIEAELTRLSAGGNMEIHHASQVIEMNEPSKVALREKADSSITRAIHLLKDGKADAVVTAGHTGATVAASTILLRCLPGIRRPGLAVPFPAHNDRKCLVIDVGANIGCEPEDLLHYGEMASVFVETVDGIKSPSVGLMSVGSEAAKGNKLVKQTQELFENSDLNYKGNAEGGDVFGGKLDVLVCDGFVGNVMLKALEGLAVWVTEALRDELSRTWWLKLGAAACKPGFRELRSKLDTAGYGGAPLLGVKGNVIITHGASGPRAISYTIQRALDLAKAKVNERISAEVTQHASLDTEVEDA